MTPLTPELPRDTGRRARPRDPPRAGRPVAGRARAAAHLRDQHRRQRAVRVHDDRPGVRLRRDHRAGDRAEHRGGPRRDGRARHLVPGGHGGRGAEGRRHHRPPPRRRDHAVPAAGRPTAAASPAATCSCRWPGTSEHPTGELLQQRQQRRRGDLVPDRAVPVRRRRRPHARHHARAAVRHRPGPGARRLGRLPVDRRPHRRLQPPHVAAHDARAAAARRGQRHRARVLRRRARRQDAGPRGRRDRALPRGVVPSCATR